MDFSDALTKMPLMAVLRGVTSATAEATCSTLIDAGFTLLEVTVRDKKDAFATLDRDALTAIQIMQKAAAGKAHILAGTVFHPDDLRALADIGVTTALSPHCNPAVAEISQTLNIAYIPGIETLSEAQQAMNAGAHGVKLFPCEARDPVTGQTEVIHSPAYAATLVSFITGAVFPSGGVNKDNMRGYWNAGCAGLCIGGELYKPDRALDDIRRRAVELVQNMTVLLQGA